MYRVEVLESWDQGPVDGLSIFQGVSNFRKCFKKTNINAWYFRSRNSWQINVILESSLISY